MGKAYAWTRAPFQTRAFSLGISWVAVHSLAALLALALIPQIPIVRAANTATLLITGLVSFFLVSILQDAVLAYHVPGFRFGKWSALTVTAGVVAGSVGACVLNFVPWSTTTDLGGAIIAETPSAVERVLLAMVIGAIIGIIVGVAQSLVLPESGAWLRGKLSQRSAWVLSSVVAWFLGFGTIAWIVRFLDSRTVERVGRINASDVDAATLTLALVSGVTIVGAVTAIPLMRLFVVFQDNSETLSRPPTRLVTRGVGILWGIAAIMGALLLWGSYILAEESFLWPYSYSGPTYYGSPDEYFLMGRVLTSGMVAISAIYTLLFLTLSLKALQKGNISLEQHGTRYWAMILAASIVLVCFNIFASLTWFYEYFD